MKFIILEPDKFLDEKTVFNIDTFKRAHGNQEGTFIDVGDHVYHVDIPIDIFIENLDQAVRS